MAPIVEVNRPPRTLLSRVAVPLAVVGVVLSGPVAALLVAATFRAMAWILGAEMSDLVKLIVGLVSVGVVFVAGVASFAALQAWTERRGRE